MRPDTALSTPPVFALLDDRHASAECPSSRLYTHFAREHRCLDATTLDAFWAQVEADQGHGLHAVLLIDYEWGAQLLGAGQREQAPGTPAALRVLMFEHMTRMSRAQVDDWLQSQCDAQTPLTPQEPPTPCGVMNLAASVDRAAFTQAIDRISALIQAGETYQVNYTYRLHGQAYGSPIQLYCKLRARQPVAFGALIRLPGSAGNAGNAGEDGGHILSCSPELFLRHEAGVLTARPMKGTASRLATPEADSATAHHLAHDTKNRAENLMIVDLLRNDLGRVATTGSVKVPQLFTIEPYATVFQMTSTVQARLLPDLGFADILRATFPCGSITGAPKHHTMDLIAQLETEPRGIYCGAIGWIDAPTMSDTPARCGDFCLSVAIRTATLGTPQQGLRPVTIGVGAGIVLDSRADDEFEECQLKARFLTGLNPGFALFETMRVTRLGGIAHLDRHLQRLRRSARTLGFVHDEAAIKQALQAELHTLRELLWQASPDTPLRLRLALAHDGSITLNSAPLPDLPWPPAEAVPLLLSKQRLAHQQTDNAYLALSAHKTTHRQHYDQGMQEAQAEGAFDSLFFTPDGRLVEGGRSNVFLQLDGQWWTPPVADGALPGVMRSVLLDDPAWSARERSLTLDDLKRAQAIVVCNALRGALHARCVGLDA